METVFILSSVLLWVLVLLNIVLTLALVRKVNSDGGSGLNSVPLPRSGLEKGTSAPDFAAQNLHGETVTLAAYQGRAVAFLFVSPTCGPCHDAIPRYDALYTQALSRGTELVLVSSGNGEATHELIGEFKLQMSVLVAPQPDNPFFTDYQVTSTPTYCLVAKDGTVQSSGHPSFQRGEWKDLAQSWEARKHNEPQVMKPVPSGGG